jgi:hypothetical protein
MWETIQRLMVSQHPWSSFFYLVVGALLGAFVSILLTVKAQRPRLIICGAGSGSSSQGQRWSLSILNRPAFIGVPFAGETARDVHAWLTLRERDSSSYMLYWNNGQQKDSAATIEPGQPQTVEVFSSFPGTRGYCVLDQAGEAVARFDARELRFVLRLNDRLGRMTELPLTVKFDESHLKNQPQLQIFPPLYLETRLQMVKSGLRQLLTAVRIRR